MNSLSPHDLLQLAAGAAGAFLGGLILVWRIRTQLPHLARKALEAVRSVIKEEARVVVKEELTEPNQRIQAVETHVQQLRHHVGLPSIIVRTAGR